MQSKSDHRSRHRSWVRTYAESQEASLRNCRQGRRNLGSYWPRRVAVVQKKMTKEQWLSHVMLEIRISFCEGNINSKMSVIHESQQQNET
jgi:hypothetical protein